MPPFKRYARIHGIIISVILLFSVVFLPMLILKILYKPEKRTNFDYQYVPILGEAETVVTNGNSKNIYYKKIEGDFEGFEEISDSAAFVYASSKFLSAKANEPKLNNGIPTTHLIYFKLINEEDEDIVNVVQFSNVDSIRLKINKAIGLDSINK